jgi:hypothetical protein
MGGRNGGGGAGMPRTLNCKWSEAARISFSVRPRAHTITSATAKYECSLGYLPLPLMCNVSGAPPALVAAKFSRLTRIGLLATFEPHITNQSVSGVTLFSSLVLHPM